MQTQYDNVLILGAGASADAGIPVLTKFLDTMWRFSTRKKFWNGDVPEQDLQTLEAAEKIRRSLESYNSRATFDTGNIEDVLSLLSLEAMLGEKEVKDYEAMVKAITRTIELACEIPYRDMENPPFEPHQTYDQLWDILLDKRFKENRPALMTFNYDLVLERSLWEYFCKRRDQPLKVKSCHLKYFSDRGDTHIRWKSKSQFNVFNVRFAYEDDDNLEEAEVQIPYLKLHGSLNWGRSKLAGTRRPHAPTRAVETPLILPPVFNKMKSGDVDEVWGEALRILRSAKHIIIIGYSLPKTDTYMQYFLKSAVGPNGNLQKIIVFDPTLFDAGKPAQTEDANNMRSRYNECFAKPLINRIVFNPSTAGLRGDLPGKLAHFLYGIDKFRDEWFF